MKKIILLSFVAFGLVCYSSLAWGQKKTIWVPKASGQKNGSGAMVDQEQLNMRDEDPILLQSFADLAGPMRFTTCITLFHRSRTRIIL